MLKKCVAAATGALLALVACTSIPYKDDVGFLVSAQANSPEFPVYISGKLCADMEGQPGACTKRVRSNEAVQFRFDAQVYSYLLTVNCTSGVTRPEPAVVPAGSQYIFEIKPEAFSLFTAFTCTGEVSPQDRSPPISSRFRVQVVVVDTAYVARERAFVTRDGSHNKLVLGQFARSAWVRDQGVWKQYSKTTEVPILGDPAQVKAYSESFASRFNYLGLNAQDGPISP